MAQHENNRLRPTVRDTVVVVAFTLALFSLVLSVRANLSAGEHDVLLHGVSRILRTTNGAARLNALEVEKDALRDELDELRTRMDALETAAKDARPD